MLSQNMAYKDKKFLSFPYAWIRLVSLKGGPMKSRAFSFIVFSALFFLSFCAGFVLAQPASQRQARYPKFEIGLLAGLSTSRALGTTTYQDSWSSFLLSNVTEKTTIESQVKNGLQCGGYVSYFITRHLGFQLLAEYMKADVPNSANLDFGWTWSDGSNVQNNKVWTGTGRLTSIPISLDVVVKVNAGRLEAQISGGATYFRNTLREDSVFGYGVMRIFTTYVAPDWVMEQSIDALPVGLTIADKTWYAWGANIGLGLNFRLTGAIGLRGEARYLYCPKKNLSWDFVLGTYNGVFSNDIQAEPFTDQDAAYLLQNNQTFSLQVNPSFFQVALGVVLFFGRR